MQKSIIITTSFVGFHSWPDAPEEVGFLRQEHRHIFQMKVELKVQHNDRDLEFFMCKKLINERIDQLFNKHPIFDWYQINRSCEQIAEDFYNFSTLSASIISIEVSEDGENSGKIVF